MHLVYRTFTYLLEKKYLLELMSYDLFLSILIGKRKINIFLMVKLFGWSVPIRPGLSLLMFY